MIHDGSIRRAYESYAQYILTGFEVYKNDPVLLRIFVEGIRNQIFDLAPIHTGYISKRALASGDKPTDEHIYPRKQSAKRIVHYLVRMAEHGKPVRVKRVTDFLKSRARVHRVLDAENNMLRGLQRKNGYHWKRGYKEMGIELVYDPIETSERQKYRYEIEGKVYDRKSDVFEDFSELTMNQLNYRLESSSPKWRNWKYVNIA